VGGHQFLAPALVGVDAGQALRGGVAGGRATWADVGSGSGAFTLVLADLLGPGATIVSIDRDAGALRRQALDLHERFPGVRLDQRIADFRDDLELPVLDGLVMANALHFVARDEQVAVVRRLAAHLRPGGRFVVVEYDAERGNPWVPTPFGPRTFQRMAAAAGLTGAREIGRVPSRWLGAIWSGVSERPSGRAAG
jgi:SAM-dependent methyltransferase